MHIKLQDPVGGIIRLEAQVCPNKGEKVLVRGRTYVVEKVSHEVQEHDKTELLVTTVQLDLYKPTD